MNYSEIKLCDIANGPGIRITLFVSGCRNNCEGCHNKCAQNFNYGKIYTQEDTNFILKELEKPYYSGITLCGGEPFEPENQEQLYYLVSAIKQKFNDTRTIWCYTGYELETLPLSSYKDKLLSQLDFLITGRFILALRDITKNNKWRGSINQRIIDVQKTLSTGVKVLAEGFPNNS